MQKTSCFSAIRTPLSGRGDETRSSEDADDPHARGRGPQVRVTTSSPRSGRLSICALIAVAAAIAALLSIHVPDVLSAQDAGTATTTGNLVVVPGVVQQNETVLAVGFHVDPPDLQVEIRYSEHFTPEDETCDNAGTAGTAEAATAPVWITLNACTQGDAYVRLVESATGNVIEDVSVTVIEPGATGKATTISISGLTSNDLVPGGSGDRFSVAVTNLESNKDHELHTVVLNSLSAAFDEDCEDFRVSTDIIAVPSLPRITPCTDAWRRRRSSGPTWKTRTTDP